MCTGNETPTPSPPAPGTVVGTPQAVLPQGSWPRVSMVPHSLTQVPDTRPPPQRCLLSTGGGTPPPYFPVHSLPRNSRMCMCMCVSVSVRVVSKDCSGYPTCTAAFSFQNPFINIILFNANSNFVGTTEKASALIPRE